ncbi:hypothetical protein KC331_g8700 [Hortaea werneckii]|nr:hypothetical protein KC331_g8700 [Hortaea werneckii]KAI7710685.1 hypothetical protein KC353_g9517 [Hortaea werneckii]
MGSNSSQPTYPTQTDAALSAPPTQHGDSHIQSSQQTNGQPEIAETPSADPHSGGEIHVASPRSKVANPRTKRPVNEMENADGDPGAKSRSRKRARKSSEGQKARGRPRDPSQLTRTQPPAEEATQPQQPETQQAEANGVSQVSKNKKRKLSKADRHAQELAESFIANGEAHGPSDTVDDPTTSQAEQGKPKRQRRKADDSEPIRDSGANVSSEAPAEEQGQDNEGKETEEAPRSKRKKRAAQPAAAEAEKHEAKNSPDRKPQRKVSRRGNATNEATRRSDDNDIRTGSKSPEVPESQPVDAGEPQNVPESESQQHEGDLQVSPKGKTQKRKKRKSASGEGPPVASEDGPSSEPRTGKAKRAARKEKADASTGATANRNIGKTSRQRSQQPTPSKSPSGLDGRDQVRDAAAPEDHNGGASSKRDAQDPPTYDMDATDHVRNWLSSQPEASTDAQASGSGKHSPMVNGGHRNGQRDSAPGQSDEEEHQSTSIHRAQASKRQPRAKPGDSDVSMASLPAPVVNGPAAGAFDSSEKAAADAVFAYMCRQEGLTPTQMRVKVSDWRTVGDFKMEMQAALPNRNQRAIRKFCLRRFTADDTGPWTEEQDELLRMAYTEHPNQWAEIGRTVGRTAESCRDRWRHHLTYSNADTGPWSREEEEKLVKAVNECLEIVRENARKENNGEVLNDRTKQESLISWNMVADKMDGKRGKKRCYEKWRNMKYRAPLDNQTPNAAFDTTAPAPEAMQPQPPASKFNPDSKKQRNVRKKLERFHYGDYYDVLAEIQKAIPDGDQIYNDESTVWSVISLRNQDSRFSGALRRAAYHRMLEIYGSSKGAKKSVTIAGKSRAMMKALAKWAKQEGIDEFERSYRPAEERDARQKQKEEETKKKEANKEMRAAKRAEREAAAARKEKKEMKSAERVVESEDEDDAEQPNVQLEEEGPGDEDEATESPATDEEGDAHNGAAETEGAYRDSPPTHNEPAGAPVTDMDHEAELAAAEEDDREQLDAPGVSAVEEATPRAAPEAADGLTVSSLNSRYDFTLADNLSLDGGEHARVGSQEFLSRVRGTGRNQHRDYLRRMSSQRS